MKRDIDKIINECVGRCLRKYVAEARSEVETYYHGGDRNDDLFYNGELWLSDEPWYAYAYARERRNPVIWKVVIDRRRTNLASVFELDDGFDPYDGIDDETREYFDEEGIDGYTFPLSWEGYDTECVVLKDRAGVVSVTPMTEEEYKIAENEFNSL